MSAPAATPQLKLYRKVTSAAGYIFLFMSLALIIGVICALAFRGTAPENLTQAQLFNLIKAGRVVNLVNVVDPSNGMRALDGVYEKSTTDADTAQPRVAFRVQIDLMFQPNLLYELRQAGYLGTIETVTKTDIVWPLIINFLPIILFVGLMYGLMRWQVRMARDRLAQP